MGYATEKILHTYTHKDSLFIRVQIEANCSLGLSNIEGSISKYEDTLNLDFHIIEPETPYNYNFPPEPIPEADCNCLFWLDYILNYPNHIPIPSLTLKKVVLQHYKGFELLEKEKINILDSIGRRQGKWIYGFGPRSAQDKIYYYKNDVLVKSEFFYFDFFLKEHKNEPLHVVNYKRMTRTEHPLSNKGIIIEYKKNGEEKNRKCYALDNPRNLYDCD